MIETKLVQKFGNSGHVVLPKEYVGKRIRFIAEPKTFEDVKSEVLEFLMPYLDNILGVYLYGSYARNEQTIDSDVDILVVASAKLKIIDKIDNYSIISVTLEEIDKTLENNAVLILPILKEAKTLINSGLLERYSGYKFPKMNIKGFIDSSLYALELNKKGLELNFELGSVVYSLILRIRSLLMIKLILADRLYSKSYLFNILENNNLPKNKIEALYKIYFNEKNNIRVKESNIIKNGDVVKLLTIAEKLLRDVSGLLK